MGWISEMGFRFTNNVKRSLADESKNDARLGILSFEVAKIMSRLVSLYNSLSDDEMMKLRNSIMKSEGIAYLNSNDESFLLNLACAERLEDVDKAASAVARLGHKCSDCGLNWFDVIYTDLKLGIIDLGKLEYRSRGTEKRIEKMEGLISATACLYSALEGLTELEISERKLQQWKNNKAAMQSQKMNFDLFDQKIALQRKQVRHYRQISLWSKTFDKSVGLMARIVCIVYARICTVFGPDIPALPSISLRNTRCLQQRYAIRVQPEYCFIEPIREQVNFRSGPIPKTSKPYLVRFYSRKSILFSPEDCGFGTSNRVFHAAEPSTVGGSGLAVRYANVIQLAERYLDSGVTIGDDAREGLYQMLPENLKTLVRSKLSRNLRTMDNDESLAVGWREALTAIMGWLAPMAHDTLKWQVERNFEKMNFDTKPSVLLLQTLHFSNKEKTEAAIAEVLVGLSCIYRLFFFFIFLSLPASSQQDEFFFSGFHGDNTNLSLNGVAEIEKNGILQLTNYTLRLMGHAFYSSPLQFKNSTNGDAFSFSTCFAFAISPEYPKLGGHGLAFTISPSKDFKSALPSQYLGLLNANDTGNFSNHLFAVEFDTVQDFEFRDINDNHVGIDINSLDSNISAAAAFFADDGTKQDVNLKSGKAILAWIEYDSITNLINVTISPSSAKPRFPILSFHCDLSPILHEKMYIGFSSSTGLLASSHYILGWSFKMNGDAKSLNLHSLPSLPGTKKKHTILIIVVSILSIVLVIGAIFIAIYLIKKIKNRDVIEAWELEVGPHRYSYQELKQATRGFKDSELIGHGGFGRVYKGTLPNSKTEVAVKQISHESKQGLKEFVAEIASIGRLRHRNLVQLLGWCRRRGDLLLVYDFMPNESLDKHLFDEPKTILSWEQRFKIVKGVASGLLYLHEGYEQIVIHRDVKASNVLLDGELNGRLGDFGLAKLYEHGSNPGTTRVVGTLGYLAPELPRTGKASTWSDVFAFGALLLEVVCGRRPIESKALPEELVLMDWVWDKLREGRVLDVVDPKLEGEFDENEVLMVLKLGLMCSNYAPLARPSMRQVMRYLEGEIGLPEDLRAPATAAYGGEKRGGEGLDDYVHSLDPLSFDKVSSSSFEGNRDVDASFASISTSPLSLLYHRGEAR
ncbi:hypothetical protein F0562_016686 [Nyssa sinensis]|uniref:non-specific serine/threonine protein kinase n=1 Tax=Nyssa sinensis TaxID=561372 RepID=A0A5J4ZCP1_9ASTE|nr:hypothetical protein F0562_016686 [Nyssa sinensis]